MRAERRQYGNYYPEQFQHNLKALNPVHRRIIPRGKNNPRPYLRKAKRNHPALTTTPIPDCHSANLAAVCNCI